MNISLRLLRYVAAAADCRNVTEAARRLQVSQPSVSAAIAELEQMLGITIFVRHHAKGVTLTPAGQRLINEARLLLKHAEEFSKTAEALSDTERGEITIGCFPTLAARFMPSLMLNFSERHPMISLRLEEGDQDQLMRDLAQGRIEMAVSFIYGVSPGFDTVPLLSLPPVVALPANHRLARASDVSLTELKNDPLILYDGPSTSEYIISLFEALGMQPNIAVRVKSFELMRGLVGRGHGYGVHTIVPLTSTTYDGGHILIKPVRDKLPHAQVVSITPGSHLVRPAVKLFAEFLESALRGGSLNDDKPVAASSAA
ncbi:MAG: LysR family transcriptional regulator [Rhodomicrobium sp.]